jgi:hypothetical protein
LSADDIIVVDTVNLDDPSGSFPSHITAENGLAGYVDFGDMVEVRALYVKKLNVRDKPSTSGKVIDVLERGEPIRVVKENDFLYLETPEYEDGIGWREIRMGNSIGWVAEEYTIEKRFYDILEPAIEKYEAGDTPGMGEYLDEVSGHYEDVECSIASDGKTATVLFDYYDCIRNVFADNKCLFIVGKPNVNVHSGTVYDTCFSPGGDYTYVHPDGHMYDYWGGYSVASYVEVFDNRNGGIVYMSGTHPGIFLREDRENASDLVREFIDDRYLLLVVLDSSLPEVRENRGDFWDFYPYLIMVDLSNGSETILLEPDFSTLDGVSVRMKRPLDFNPSLGSIKKAMDTPLFKRCEKEILTGAWNEA